MFNEDYLLNTIVSYLFDRRNSVENIVVLQWKVQSHTHSHLQGDQPVWFEPG